MTTGNHQNVERGLLAVPHVDRTQSPLPRTQQQQPIITITELAQALRLGTDLGPVDSTLVGILERQMEAGINEITQYADAPAANASEALIRLVGFYFDRPNDADPFTNSGARAMLSRWHIPEGTKI